MTLAPRRPSATAIARPMPRDPPVTSATLPWSAVSVMAMAGFLRWAASRGECVDLVGLADRGGVDRRRDALDQALEHRARAELVTAGDAELGDPLDRLLPAHRPGDLLDQELADLPGIAGRLRRDIADHRHAGHRDRRAG